MIVTLLLVTFVIAAVVSTVTRLFDQPIATILRRIVSDELGVAWQRYVTFAI